MLARLTTATKKMKNDKCCNGVPGFAAQSAGWSARRRRCRIAAVLLVCSAFAGFELRAAGLDSVRALIANVIPSTYALLGASAMAHGGSQALQSVYSSTGNAPLWIREGRATPQAQAVLRELQNAENYGLETKDYRGNEIAQLLDVQPSPVAPDDARQARFDVTLSAAALRFVSDLHYGRVSPGAAGFKLQEERPPFDLAAALKDLASASDVGHAVASVEPTFYHYGLLKDALARLRKVLQQQDFAQLPPPPARLKVGDVYEGAPALRRMLSTMGDLAAADTTSLNDATFDANLSAAVSKYQVRHGLSSNGQLDKATFAALRTPPARRIRQITLTLERWRWLTPFKTPPIIVNIPQFRLFAFRTTEDRVADILQMDVIVGRTYPQTQTPVFEGDMRYVILRPYWDVPYSITQHEMLAKIRADPRYMTAQHLEIAAGPDDSSPAVPATPENLEALAAGKLRLRQQPGADNALGLAKFMFPNSYNVYLHSTPAHSLFKESVRTFSHGCIRVSDPLALATLVLKDAPGDWTPQKIQAAMNGDETVRVNLKHPINVLILYATALATEAGPIMFFEDIYGYDKKLEQQLGLQPMT
jgi:murein L,D-transpeptidase YcbB/YkuD